MAHSVGGRASAYASTGLVSDPVTNRLKTQDSEHSLLVSQLTHPLRSQSVGAPALHATTSSHQPCQHEPFKHLVFLTTCIAFDPQTPLLAVVIPSSHQPFMPAVHSHSLCRPGSSESIHSGLYADHPLHLASTDPYFTLVWTLRSSVAASSRWSSFALPWPNQHCPRLCGPRVNHSA